MLTSSYHGSLVAFEGSSDSSISTQLRLLPVSPQILILPNIINYLPNETPESTFHAATFIRKVHDAAAARLEAAFNFLGEATPDAKRLVFLNGGTTSAHALCVKAIAQHETNGNFEKAERRLQTLIAGGLAGLSEVGKKNLQKRPSLSFASALDDADAFLFQDPITRAMRAADALDRQTESLQPSTDLDLTLSAARRPRPRSMSLPIYGYVDHLGDSAPFYVFGARAEGGGRATEEQAIDDSDEDNPGGRTFFLQSPRLELRSFYDEPDDIDLFKLDSSLKTPLSPRSPSCIGEAYWPPISSAIAQDDEVPVVLGEASIIHIAPSSSSSSSSRRSLKRARSLDRMSMSRARYRDLPLRLPSSRDTDQGFENLDGARRFSCVDIADERGLPLSPTSTRASYVGAPRTVFVRRSSAAKVVALAKPKKERKTGSALYVDRGTDAEDIIMAAEDAREPVLPFKEDLVVYFKNGRPDALVEKFIQAFRDGGAYAPVQPSQAEASNNGGSGSGPETTARVTVEVERVHARNEPCQEVISDHPSPGDEYETADDEYDPFSYQKQPPPLITSTCSKAVIVSTTIVTLSPSAPPTPAHTPPPPASPLHPVETTPRQRTIRDFAVPGSPTAVAVQNALRSLLAEYFPAEEDGFHQFNFHHLPELDGLWRPIFREAGSGSDGRDEEGGSSMRMVDQIIAFGSQAGVKKEFVSSVGRRLEKLGAQPSGISRSGRIDFRYLIANAMQAFTAQPLAKQSNDNPFTNPYLLATLIIPHLETYLAAHSEVRLLILEYPPEHLATVLAIQRLVGVDLMKVAQIVDSSSSDSPFAPIRSHGGSLDSTPSHSPAMSSPAGYSGVINLSPTLSAEKSLTPATANYLLTSTATDAEVSTFLSTISKILFEISPFYAYHNYHHTPSHQHSRHHIDTTATTTERSPDPRSISPPLSGATFSTIPHLTISSQSQPLSPTSTQPPLPQRSLSPIRSVAAPSPSPTETPVQTPRSQQLGRFSPTNSTVTTTASVVRDNNRKRLPLKQEDEGVGLDLEDDSDFEDMEEKRLLPIFMRRPVARKGSSHKALKFLGLA